MILGARSFHYSPANSRAGTGCDTATCATLQTRGFRRLFSGLEHPADDFCEQPCRCSRLTLVDLSSRQRQRHDLCRHGVSGILVPHGHGDSEGEVERLDLSYLEILGLLAWAFLLVTGLYLLFAKRKEILLVAFAVMVALNTLSTMGWLDWTHHGLLRWNPFEAGLSSMTMAGVLATFVVVGDTVAPGFRQKVKWILGGAAILFAIGFALQPLGISKNRDTPTWCLYCTAANLLIVLLLYWLADVKGWKVWANFAKPAGANPLLPYMLAYVPFLLLPLYLLRTVGTSGSWGVIKSALLTILVLLITRVLLRFGVTLRV